MPEFNWNSHALGCYQNLKMCYLKNHFNDNLWDNYNLQRKWGIDTKTKAIERKNKNLMWIWERKLSQKLLKNSCTNNISQI